MSFTHVLKSESKQIYFLKLKDVFARQNITALIRAKKTQLQKVYKQKQTQKNTFIKIRSCLDIEAVK